MKPFLRALFLMAIFLAFNGLFLWQKDVANFFQANISQLISQTENETVQTDTEIEPIFRTEEVLEIQNLTSSHEKTVPTAVGTVFSLADIQEQIDDISEKIDILSEKVRQLIKENTGDRELAKEEIEKIEETKKEEKLDEEEINEDEEIIDLGQEVGQSFCMITSGMLPLQNSIVINEVAWMGSVNSSNDEWIELKNLSNQAIDLTGWQIQSRSDNIKFIFPKGASLVSGEIGLLERVNDDSVPQISADFIYNGALKNENEALYLFDKDCQVKDAVEVAGDWTAGENNSKRTMERRGDFSWQTSLEVGGTPKAKNSSGLVEFLAVGGSSESPKPTFLHISISEIKISEKRGDKNIFIELYNPNGQEVDLSDWYLQRKSASSSEFDSFVSKNLFSGKKILAKTYFLLSRQNSDFEPISDLIFENTLTENNAIILKNPNQEITDQASWQSVPASNSWGRIYDEQNQTYEGQFEIQTLTPKEKNKSLENQSLIDENFDATSSPATTTDATTTTATTTIATSSPSVVINEIAWMGNASSSANEWFELYNNTDSDIDLTNWKILKNNQGFIIFATSEIKSMISATIVAHQYYLLERTDDNSVENIPADLIYTGSLNNDGEKLELRDEANNLIDSVDCSADWFSGDNATKQTMERIDPTISGNNLNNWRSSQGPGGTPRAKNSVL